MLPNNLLKITSRQTGSNLAENSGAGQTVYRVTATDPEGDAITYAFGGGADDALLVIDKTTGVVTLPIDPDYETQSSYSFDVKALSNGLR